MARKINSFLPLQLSHNERAALAESSSNFGFHRKLSNLGALH